MSRQLCTFTLGDMIFGIDVETVQEVIRYQEMTPVLSAPEAIAGLINLRGQIVTAINLRRRIQLPDANQGERPMNVVVRTSDGAVSLLVDKIGDVVDVDSSTFEGLPDCVRGEVRRTTIGVHKLRQGLLHVLDLAATLDNIVPSGGASEAVFQQFTNAPA